LANPIVTLLSLKKTNVKLSVNLIIIGMLLPGEPDRGPQFFQHLKIFVKASFGDSHFSGEFGRRPGSLPADVLIQFLEKVQILLHDDKV
jgi:hypothetical protein